MKLPPVSMMVAMTPKGVIGNKGSMPWHLARDMKRFVKFTTNSAVVMGPKTYASLPPKHRPLKNRLNIVLTSNRDYKPEPDVLVAHNPSQALELAAIKGWHEFFVIGGAMVYMSFLQYAETLYVTYVDADIKGDTYFPHWEKEDWREVWLESEWKQPEGDHYPTRFAEYRRVIHATPTKEISWRHPDELRAKMLEKPKEPEKIPYQAPKKTKKKAAKKHKPKIRARKKKARR